MSRCLRLKSLDGIKIPRGPRPVGTERITAADLKVPEADVLKSVLADLQADPRVWWVMRNNTGAVTYTDEKGEKRFVRYGKKGVSDVIGMLQGGRFFVIETKRRGKRPTTPQAEFIELITRGGGVAGIAYCVDDARAILNRAMPRNVRRAA